MEKIRAERAVNNGLYEQRTRVVIKANKGKRRERKFFNNK